MVSSGTDAGCIWVTVPCDKQSCHHWAPETQSVPYETTHSQRSRNVSPILFINHVTRFIWSQKHVWSPGKRPYSSAVCPHRLWMSLWCHRSSLAPDTDTAAWGLFLHLIMDWSHDKRTMENNGERQRTSKNYGEQQRIPENTAAGERWRMTENIGDQWTVMENDGVRWKTM